MARSRPAREATPEYLERVAHWYLERWGGTRARLRRVLLRRVNDSAAEHGTDPEQGAAEVEQLIARLAASRLVDDRAFARSAVRRMRAGGRSRRAIVAWLRQRGVGGELVDALLDDEPDPAAAELAGAVKLARRRRLGPFRLDAEQRAERRQRDLAALGRAGFAASVAYAVIDAESVEALDPDGLGQRSA